MLSGQLGLHLQCVFYKRALRSRICHMDGLDPFERNIHEYVWVGGAPPFCMFMCCELVRKWVLVSHLGKRFNNFKCLYDPQDSIQN